MNNAETLHIAVVGVSGCGKSAFCAHARELTAEPFKGYNFEWTECPDADRIDASRYEAAVLVVDATNIEESLLLVPRLVDKHRKLVLAFNRYRQLTETGHTLDFHTLSLQTGATALPVDAVEGTGVAEVIDAVIATHEDVEHTVRPILVAPDADIGQTHIGFVQGLLKSALLHPADDDRHDHTRTNKIDAILTHKVFGLPILVAVLYLVFQCTFTLGAYPQEWIQAGIDWLADYTAAHMPEAWYTSLLTDGIIQGVGAVLAFLPNIIILFFFISLMEDTGYMHRLAFLMDKLMHRVGLHGRSFVPMLVGFGCNVPAIMAARNIPDRKERTLTMLMIPFMSCSARLPVYLLFVSAFFADHKALVMISLYLVGMVLSIIFALIMKRTKYFRQDETDYVSELPPFHRPAWRHTAHHIWERCADYLKKISTVILWASIIIWALYYFPRNEQLVAQQTTDFEKEVVQKENSALASIGHWMEPVMQPLGFDWRMNVCILTGLPAKEAIVSTMGILYHQDSDTKLAESLAANPFFTPVKAYAFLIFVLLYFPCVATIATLWREAGRKWALFTVVNSLVLAWLMAFLVFQIGSLF